MKVLFDLLIDTFGLAVGLWMICGGQIGFCAGHSVEISHELCCELGTLIADGFSWEAELGPDMVAIDTGGAKGGEFHIHRECYDIFRESIYNDDDGVVSR